MDFVKLSVSDYIAKVVMDRPPVNAQNAAFRSELIQVMDALTDRDVPNAASTKASISG